MLLLIFGSAIGFTIGALRLPPYRWIKSVVRPSENGSDSQDSYSAIKTSVFWASSANSDVVMLGDSITDFGEWPELLPYPGVINRGIMGQKTEDILERLDEVVSRKPKIVCILVGINDLASGASPESVFGNTVKIVETLRKQQIRPIVQSILYVSNSFKPGLNQRVAATNRLISAWCEKQGVEYLDLNSELSDGNQLFSSLTIDGLHLNGRAYSIWAGMLRKLLGEAGADEKSMRQ